MTGYCQVPLAIKTPAEDPGVDPALGSPEQDNSVLQLAPPPHTLMAQNAEGGPAFWPAARVLVSTQHRILPRTEHCLSLALNRSTFGLSLQMTFHGPYC